MNEKKIGFPYEWLEPENHLMYDEVMQGEMSDLFRAEAQVIAMTVGRVLVDKKGWAYVERVNELRRKHTMSEFENFWQDFSNKENISLADLWRCEALRLLMWAIEANDEGNEKSAWSYLNSASLFTGRVIGLEGAEIPESFKRILEGASKGGKKHHAEDRNEFKETYRLERTHHPDEPRPTIVARLAKRESVKQSTLARWAKDADREDGFIRKGGRPKKG